MTVAPDPHVEMSPRDGYRVEWLPETDPAWRLLHGDDPRLCRRPHCRRPAVAVLMRRQHFTGRGSWLVPWAYCDLHLYGRRLRHGRLERQQYVPESDAQPSGAAR